MSETANMDVVPDSEHRGIVARLPQVPRGLAQFAHPARCPPQIVVDKIESRYTLGGELGR